MYALSCFTFEVYFFSQDIDYLDICSVGNLKIIHSLLFLSGVFYKG